MRHRKTQPDQTIVFVESADSFQDVYTRQARKIITGIVYLKVHLTPKFFLGQDETLQYSHKEFDNTISIWYF